MHNCTYRYKMPTITPPLSFADLRHSSSIHPLSFSICPIRKVSRNSQSHGLVLHKLCWVIYREHHHQQGNCARRFFTFASSDDGTGVSSNSDTGSYVEIELEETRSKLNASFQLSEAGVDYTQSLHEAARKFQLAAEQHESLRKNGWFSKSWLGVDQISWIKPVSYQAAVHSLLQAVLEIASRGHGGDRDTHVFVQRSISRQLNPLQESINQQFSARNTNVDAYFWSEQHPLAVASFVDLLESDPRFTTVTSVGWEGASVCPSIASDVSLMTLAISSAAAIVKLGSAKLSCAPFFSTLMDEIGRLMDMLGDFLPIDQVYNFASSVGLRNQFLGYFGPRAVRCQNSGEGGEERTFWVDIVQKLLRGAIVREHIRTKLTAYDSIEVLERDLAVFGFFAALGRRTQRFLIANNCGDSDETIADLLRYLIGGSISFYPQLASLNTYELFIEVACEEMEWLPFYPAPASTSSNGHNEQSSSPNEEAIILGLDQCSQWISDFLKYGTWVQQPAGARALSFLLRSQARLNECNQSYPNTTQQKTSNKSSMDMALQASSFKDIGTGTGIRNKSSLDSEIYRKNFNSYEKMNEQDMNLDGAGKMEQLILFDKELEDVDEALRRLECLLPEQEGPGKGYLTAACTNLETIRRLKKEVEMLEDSLRKKANAMSQAENPLLQQQRREKNRQGKISSQSDRQQEQIRSSNDANKLEWVSKEDEGIKEASPLALPEASSATEIESFELLRQELMDLERRVKETSGKHLNGQDTSFQSSGGEDEGKLLSVSSGASNEASIKGDIITQSLEKIKETTTDVWRGTQLLATDVAAATVLLKRSASGEELTERENKVLKRTLTDMASVIPIGILMLLPVTAVGHAAMLAAIQRYAPGMIPSAYARERLDLIKQLEQIREMGNADSWDEKKVLTLPSADTNVQSSRRSDD